jgi:Domain of unknown function (DUF1844)
MIPSHSSEGELAEASRADTISALFANLVIQQTNTALMLMGQVPNPETGERIQDFDGASMFIDQLEMLEVKTKGNLDKREDQLLKQSLTSLRMAFVEAVEASPPHSEAAAPKASSQPAESAAASSQANPEPPNAPAGNIEDEPRKKFSKKY